MGEEPVDMYVLGMAANFLVTLGLRISRLDEASAGSVARVACVSFPILAASFYPLRKDTGSSSLQRSNKPLAIITREGFDEVRRQENRRGYRRCDGYRC